jgi:hypothetical protein
VLTNGGVGDVAWIVAESGAGVIVDAFGETAYRQALDQLEELPLARDDWRRTARSWFDLEAGIERYDAIYRSPATDSNRATSRGACEASE